VKQRELSRRGSRSGSFLFFYGKTGPNSQQKTPRVTPLGVFCFSQCFRPFPTDRVPHSDSLFAEPISGGRSQPACSPPTPPKSPLKLSASLLNTPLRVNKPASFGRGRPPRFRSFDSSLHRTLRNYERCFPAQSDQKTCENLNGSVSMQSVENRCPQAHYQYQSISMLQLPSLPQRLLSSRFCDSLVARLKRTRQLVAVVRPSFSAGAVAN
jgi:hypothetical protein